MDAILKQLMDLPTDEFRNVVKLIYALGSEFMDSRPELGFDDADEIIKAVDEHLKDRRITFNPSSYK